MWTPVDLRLWHFQIAADLAREKIVDFTVPRDRGRFTLYAIYENRMTPTLAQQGTAVPLQMAKQFAAFHRS